MSTTSRIWHIDDLMWATKGNESAQNLIETKCIGVHMSTIATNMEKVAILVAIVLKTISTIVIPLITSLQRDYSCSTEW